MPMTKAAQSDFSVDKFDTGPNIKFAYFYPQTKPYTACSGKPLFILISKYWLLASSVWCQNPVTDNQPRHVWGHWTDLSLPWYFQTVQDEFEDTTTNLH